MPNKKKSAKKFRLFSAVLATVCIILVGDAVAPTAAIGNSQYVWWIIMLLAFFVPYGLISAELGSQYPSDGGMYTWIEKALGEKWASRVAWYYWVNFPLWVASLADLITTYLLQMLGVEITWPLIMAIQVGYILLVTILGMFRISQSEWVSNIGAFVKFVFMAGLGILGIYVLFTQGSANPVESWTDLLPMVGEDGGFDFTGLGFVSLIIFNMLGFEVVSTFADDMKDPKKEIPKAIILGGILIAIFYLLPSFGIGVAIPLEELQTNSGLLDSYNSLMTTIGFSAGAIKAITIVVGGMFIYTLIANISSWNFGVNSVTAYAAQDGAFPRSWTKRNKSGTPYVVSIWTGVVATVISVAGILIAEFVSEDITNLFWTFFSLSLVTLLMSYLPMFVAFWKLHKRGPQNKTGYWINGGKFKIFLYSSVPLILLVLALFFTLFPEFNVEMFEYQWPLIVGACIAIVIGEIMVSRVTVTYGEWNKYTKSGRLNKTKQPKRINAKSKTKTRKATR